MSDFGRRWLSSDDSDLGISRELLQSLRDVPGPPEGAMKREWVRLGATLGAAATTAVVYTGSAAAPFAAAQTTNVLTAGAGSASGGKLASALVLKWLVPLALLGGAGTAVVFVARNEQPQANQVPEKPVTVGIPSPSMQMAQESPSVTQTSKGLAEKTAGTSEAPARAPAPNAPRDAPRAAASSSLEAERRLLERARQLVGSGRPTAALAVLDEYRREHPRPMLGQEREVLTIDALVASSQHAEAGKRARLFLERFPDSPHSSRLRRYVGVARQ